MAIRRSDGTVLGSRSPKVQEQSATIAIADLLPLEGAVVGATLTRYRERISGEQEVIPSAKVVSVGEGQFLVIDGNHRVYAAKLEGKTEVTVRIVDSGCNAKRHANEAQHARRRNRLGFKNITEVASDKERKKFTEAEIEENGAAELRAGLLST